MIVQKKQRKIIMPKIEFSHHYPKIHGQKNARLLRVDLLPQVELPADLLEYDTVTNTGDHYKFGYKNAMMLVLTFSGDHFIPFTTIRRSTTRKFLWYKSQIDQVFDLVINEEGKPEAVPEKMDL